MQLRRIPSFGLILLVVVPSLAIYGMSSGLVDRVRELFAQERYAELIEQLSELQEDELGPQERFALLASRLRIAKLRGEPSAAEDAAKALDRFAESATPDLAARVAAERIAAMQIAPVDHVDQLLQTTLAHWERHEDLPFARGEYLKLLDVLLADDVAIVAPLARMWRNLVRADAPRDEMLRLGERLLGADASGRGRLPWHIYARAEDGNALRRRVAEDVLQWNPPNWLIAIAELRLGELSEQEGKLAQAVAHFEAAARAARAEDSAAAVEAQRRLELLRRPWIQVSGAALHRPGSEPLLNLQFQNLRGARVRVHRLDPTQDLRPVDGLRSNIEPAQIYGPPSGDRVFERRFDFRDRSAYERHQESFAIERLEPGLYLCSAEPELEGEELLDPARFVLQITRMGLVMQRLWNAAGQSLEFWLVDMQSGAPQPAVPLSFHVATGRGNDVTWQSRNLRTDDEGRVLVGGLPEFVSQIVVAGERDGQPVLLHTRGMSLANNRLEPEVAVHVLTDRPLYRPGETLHFSAVLRQRDLVERRLRVPAAGRQVELIARAGDGNEFHRELLNLDGEGFLESSWRIPAGVALGSATLQLGWPEQRGAFHVSQLRIEEVRLPEFRVRVRSLDDRPAVAGDSLHVLVSAEYLWGGPVQGSVELVVRRQRRWLWRPMPVPISIESKMSIWPQAAQQEEIDRQTLSLDDAGELEWAFRTREEDADYDYVVEARVIDGSRREESGQTSIAVGKAEFALWLDPSRWCVGPGDEVELRLRVEDLNGNGRAQSGSLEIHHTVQQEKLLETRHVTSAADGRAVVRFRATESGQYRFVFRTRDGRGNELSAETAIWCADPDQRLVVQASGGLRLIAEQSEFDGPGPARVLLVGDIPDAWVYLTRSHGAGVESKLLQLQGSVKLLEIPLDDMHRPRFHLQAISAHDYRMEFAELTVEAPPFDARLDVELSFDAEHYRPGDIAHLRVRARDPQGRPSQAPFRLAVIDAALLEVVPRDFVDPVSLFHDYFTPPAPRPVLSAEQFGGYREQRADDQDATRADELLGRGVFEGEANAQLPMATEDALSWESRAAFAKEGGSEFAPFELRTDFRSTALWRTLIRPDGDGEAEIEVPLPDSITEWNALAVGIDAESRAGFAETTARARKELMVRLAQPRIFRARDRMLLTAIVHNEGVRELSATVRLSASALLIEGYEQVVTVPAGGSATAQWWATIPPRAAALRLVRDEDNGRLSVWPERSHVRVEALSADESDGLERMIDLHPFGTPMRVTAAGRFVEDGELQLQLPSDRVSQSERASLTLSPSALSACIDALPYLASYPYGCVEQTLSRFVPALAVRQAVRALGAESRRFDPELDAKIRKGLARLGELQRPDGGFGWWIEGEADAYMTSYAILALEEAERAGSAVESDRLRRARVALRAMLPRLEGRRDDLAYALVALRAAPEDSTMLRHAERLVDERDRLNDAARALLAIHESARGRGDNAQLLLAMLRNTAVHESTLDTVHWGESGSYSWRWDGAVEATAFALRAWLAIDPASAEVDQAAAWLLAQRSGAQWKSTRETANAIFALIRYAEQRGELSSEFEAIATIGDHELARMHVTPQTLLDAGATFAIDPALFADGDNRVQLRFEGEGNCYASLSLESFSAQDRPRPTSHQIAIRRELLRLLPAMTLGGEIRYHEAPFADGDSLRSNERLRVRLHVTAPIDLEYVAIEDPRAAGFEPVDALSGWQSAGQLRLRREQREDRTAFFVAFVSQGEHVIEYDLRAETPGAFHAMPAMAYAMYIPQISATSELQQLVILEGSDHDVPKP